MDDFFISYNSADKQWAHDIGDWLDQAGFITILQANDFVAGTNFVSEIHRGLEQAQRILLVLSPDYLRARFPEAEWTAVFAKDPTSQNRTLIPVRVRECEPGGLLRPIVYIDLVGLSYEKAKGKFLADLRATLKGKRPPAVSPNSAPPISPTETRPERSTVSQNAFGKNITQIAGDQNVYQRPPKKEIVFKAREGAISAEQAHQVQQWIEKLADGTVGMSRQSAFGMWWKRFKYHFRVEKYGELPAADFPLAAAWFRQQSAINVRQLKTKAPNAWRNVRYGAIHKAMASMGVDKLSYYREVSIRLKMKKPFTSLKDLTKCDLERVYDFVLRHARGGL